MLAVGVCAFLYFALMALAVGAALALTPALRPLLRRWLVASLSAGAAALPLLVLSATQTGQIAYLGQRDVVNANAVLVQMWFGTTWFAVIAWALIVVAAAGLLRPLIARSPGRRADPGRPGGRVLEVLAFAWLLIPMGLLVAVSPVLADASAT